MIEPPWLTVGVSGDAKRPLAVRWPYDPATLAEWQESFCGEGGTARWHPEDKCWLLPRAQYGTLVAVFGARLRLESYAVLRVVFPPKQPRRRAAKQLDIWR